MAWSKTTASRAKAARWGVVSRRVAVGRGVVRAQRVHEVHDRDRGAVVGNRDPGIPPEGLPRILVALEPARLEDELAAAAGVGREVHVHGLPFAVRGAGEGIQEARPDRLVPAVFHELDHELDGGLVVALGRDAGREAEVRALGDVDREPIAAGRGRVQGGADDVVDADALAGLFLDPGGVTAAHVGLDPRGAGMQEVERAWPGGRRRKRRGRSDHGEGQTDSRCNAELASRRRAAAAKRFQF